MAQFKMQALASDTNIPYFWVSNSRDYNGNLYPGTGTPIETAVAGFLGQETSGTAGVSSFNGRQSAVDPVAGDYPAALVPYDNTGTKITSAQVQGALNELEAPRTINASNGAYIFQSTDVKKILVQNSAADSNFQLNDSAVYRIGESLKVVQSGVGNIFFLEGTGTQIIAEKFAILQTNGAGAQVTLTKISAGIWYASGNLKKTLPFITVEHTSSSKADSVPWSVSTSDAIGGFASVNSSSFIIPYRGIYSFNMNIDTAWTASNNQPVVALTKNGSSFMQVVLFRSAAGSSTRYNFSFSTREPLEKNDVVEFVGLTGTLWEPSTASQNRGRMTIAWYGEIETSAPVTTSAFTSGFSDGFN